MAIDQALLESVQAGAAPVFRLYRWAPACLSLGRNQPATLDRSACAAAGTDLVRRPTGGLAVFHDQELTYALVVGAGVIGSPRETYAAVNRGLLRGLAHLEVRGARPTPDQTSAQAFRAGSSCFASMAPGEVVAQGRKLIGSAQRYEKRTLLQHGSILLAGDQSRAAWLLAAADSGAPPSITLAELLGKVPAPAELTRAFAEGVALELGICLAPATLSEAERNRALQLSAFFGSTEWTYRI